MPTFARLNLVLALLLAVAFAPAPGAADFDDGIAAMQRGDFAAAAAAWAPLAEAGDINAQYLLGNLHREGNGVPKDEGQAFALYLRAANQGMLEAQRNVGMMLGLAIGVERDDAGSFKWLTIAAGRDDQESIRALGFLTNRMIIEHGEEVANRVIGEARFEAAAFVPRPE